ncbi:hypothetical protein U9M48_015147 [Paspalum notatum var. saurae]|uniref:PMI1/PMIR1-2 C-terminal domain-containing protein n=1 Tax=Paspalum notatum var. saurae TaxID=547442 RepID=A0AAQ3WLD2_PASNO
MSRKKPQAPAVVSTGCSSLMSCLSRHRRGPQQPAPRADDDALPRRNGADDTGGAAETAEKYWKRVQLLEEEIRRLSMWLGHEERPAPPAATDTDGVVRCRTNKEGDSAGAATECVVGNGGVKVIRQEGGRASTGTGTADDKRCVRVGHGAGGVQEMVRLEDGSYMREVRRVGRPWERLAVQVSRPVVPEDAASASEVLDKMTAMRAEDLLKSLVQTMPLKDIAGRQNPGEPVRRTARLSSGDGLAEALVFKAMDKLESLALEGLKIQMASPETEPGAVAAAATADRRRDEAISKDCIVLVHVVLMQARDPNEKYGAIGDPMIGLIETSLQRKDGAVKLEMQGLHVAGISFISRTPSDYRCMMWSAYLRQCKESHDGCRCTCVRNPDRVFQR